jgi:16S rRNA processing protein RimM
VSGLRAFADLVTIGTVVKPQGRRGEVLVEPVASPDRFTRLQRAFLEGAAGEGREVAVLGRWPHKRRWVLKLEGVDSIDAAEGLRGCELRIGEEELPALPEGSYYHHQLRGLAAEDTRGRPVGRVADLVETGAAAVLVVRGPQGEVLVPLAHGFVERVDLEAGTLVIAVPELVDVED